MIKTHTQTKSRNELYAGILVLVACFSLLAIRFFLNERPLTLTGLRALWDALFAAFLMGLVLLFAFGVGKRILKVLRFTGAGPLLSTVISLALGLGCIAYGVLFLGLLGFLQALPLAFMLVGFGLLGWQEWARLLINLPYRLGNAASRWGDLNWFNKSVLLIGFAILVLTLLQALTPPWDVDGLLYHLQGPRKFLEAGRITALRENWLTFYPFTVEMLFAFGMSFGSDTFAKLVHLTFAIILVLTVCLMGSKIISVKGGWLSAAILMGIPIFPIWASLAYIDIAWAVFETLALFTLLIWDEERNNQLLILAGLLMGFSLGSKYLALGGGLVLGVWLVWRNWPAGWRELTHNLLLFGGTAILVASPWYLKNWLWTGNPLYPLFFSPEGWSVERISLWMDYMHSFGTGHSTLDYLLLPINLYAQHERFGTFLGSIEIPSFLFLLLFIFPWVKKTPKLSNLFWLTLARFIIWAFGTQQTRYLLPAFAGMSIISAYVLLYFTERFKHIKILPLVINAVVLGLLCVTLVYSVLFFVLVQPVVVVFGWQSKDSFLQHLVDDYSAIQIIKSDLETNDRVFMLWDGRGYYCDERCMPDIDHSQWTRLVSEGGSVESVSTYLELVGVTHLLLTTSDLDFILQRDPNGAHLRAADFFFNEFRPQCTKEVYSDDKAVLYALTCP